MSSGCAAFWRSPRAGIRLPKPPTLGTKRGGRRINGAYQNNSRTRNPKREAYPDLVERRLSADSPNRVWGADVTQHETDEGWPLLSRRYRCLLPLGGGVVVCGAIHCRTRPKRAGDGVMKAAARKGSDSPLGPRQPIHLFSLWTGARALRTLTHVPKPPRQPKRPRQRNPSPSTHSTASPYSSSA